MAEFDLRALDGTVVAGGRTALAAGDVAPLLSRVSEGYEQSIGRS